MNLESSFRKMLEENGYEIFDQDLFDQAIKDLEDKKIEPNELIDRIKAVETIIADGKKAPKKFRKKMLTSLENITKLIDLPEYEIWSSSDKDNEDQALSFISEKLTTIKIKLGLIQDSKLIINAEISLDETKRMLKAIGNPILEEVKFGKPLSEDQRVNETKRLEHLQMVQQNVLEHAQKNIKKPTSDFKANILKIDFIDGIEKDLKELAHLLNNLILEIDLKNNVTEEHEKLIALLNIYRQKMVIFNTAKEAYDEVGASGIKKAPKTKKIDPKIANKIFIVYYKGVTKENLIYGDAYIAKETIEIEGVSHYKLEGIEGIFNIDDFSKEKVAGLKKEELDPPKIAVRPFIVYYKGNKQADGILELSDKLVFGEPYIVINTLEVNGDIHFQLEGIEETFTVDVFSKDKIELPKKEVSQPFISYYKGAKREDGTLAKHDDLELGEPYIIMETSEIEGIKYYKVESMEELIPAEAFSKAKIEIPSKKEEQKKPISKKPQPANFDEEITKPRGSRVSNYVSKNKGIIAKVAVVAVLAGPVGLGFVSAALFTALVYGSIKLIQKLPGEIKGLLQPIINTVKKRRETLTPEEAEDLENALNEVDENLNPKGKTSGKPRTLRRTS